MKASDTTTTTRDRYRLHRSTWVVLLLAATGLALLIVPAEFVGAESAASQTKAGAPTIWYTFEHGWPWTFLRREVSANNTPRISGWPDRGIPWLQAWGWSFFGGLSNGNRDLNEPRGALQMNALVGDICVGVAILPFVAAIVEWRRRRRRRAWQFSLAELFGVIIVASAALTWWGTRRLNHEADRRLVADIPHSHFSTEYRGPAWLRRAVGQNNLPHFQRVVAGSLNIAVPVPPSRAGFPVRISMGGMLSSTNEEDAYVARVEHDRAQLTDSVTLTHDALGHIGRLTYLETLAIDAPLVTDDGLAQLGGLRRLSTLSLRNCRHVTSAGLNHLAILRRVSRLDVEGIRIDGQGLEAIGKLSNLSTLYLTDAPIESDGLGPLARLKKLQVLSISGANLALFDVSALSQCEALMVLVWNHKIYQGREAIAEFVRGK